MKHFSLIEWVDFVRGLVTPEQRQSMQNHLDQSCSSCGKTVRLWMSVSEFARHEATYKPPPNAVRIAQSLLVPLRLGLRETQRIQLARLSFDSFDRPLPQGVRGFDEAPRQLMYQFGDVFIDMRCEARSQLNEMVLTGQVVDSRKPSGGVPGIPVFLVGPGDTLFETTTNQLGEFHFHLQATGHIKLLVRLDDAALLLLLPDMELGMA